MLVRQLKHSFRHFRFRHMGLDARVPCQVDWGDGRFGWPICPEFVNSDSVVYSFGVGANVAWDMAMIDRFGCQVYAFDPTPESIAWTRAQGFRSEFQFFDYGIAAFDGELQFYPPRQPGRMHFSQDRQKFNRVDQPTIPGKVFRLSTIMNLLGHSRVDVLKLDVEGTEFECVPDMLNDGVEVDQLLVEIHYIFPTRSWSEGKELLRRILAAGYRCYYVSQRGLEFAFIHERCSGPLRGPTQP